MRPIDTAKEFFGDKLYEIVDFYFENGYVYCGPDAFALAMPHSKDILLRLDINKSVDKCDCWLIQFVTGDLKRLLCLLNDLPKKYKYIVFERDSEDIRFSDENRYRVYDMQRLMEKLNGKR